jgi:hypothetical protein
VTCAAAGRYEEAEKVMAEYEQTDVIPFTALGRLFLYTALGRYDEAFEWLNYEPHHAWTVWMAVMPEGEKLRHDPRFQDFLARLNLRTSRWQGTI